MASTPNYEGARHTGSIIMNNSSSTTLTAAVLTGVAAGTRVKEIRMHSGPTTAPGAVVVAVVLDDSVNAVVIDVVTLLNAANTQQAILRYENVYLYSTSASIKFQCRTALASGSELHIEVLGADY